YFTSSALTLGTAELMVIAIAMGLGDVAASLRPALIVLVLLKLVTLVLLIADLRAALARGRPDRSLALIGGVALLLGSIIPLCLVALGAPGEIVTALVSLVIGAAVIRQEIVALPHRVSIPPQAR